MAVKFNFTSNTHRSPSRNVFGSDESDLESPVRESTRGTNKVAWTRTAGARTSSIFSTSDQVQPRFQPSQPSRSSPPSQTTRPSQPSPLSQPSFTSHHNIKHYEPQNMTSIFEAAELKHHLALLHTETSRQEQHELRSTPIFTSAVVKESPDHFSQYGYIGVMSDVHQRMSETKEEPVPGTATDPRLFFNISAPSSAFICGSQGSGKSHTLSCLLENCLLKSSVSKLDNPLAGLVFHYDTFTSDKKGTPCEAAHLASNFNIRVKVLCAPTNIETIKRTYEGIAVEIIPLLINETDLSTKRMLDLMAVSQDDGPMPLYLHTISRILRDLRMIQQRTPNGTFNYAAFKAELEKAALMPGQLAPLSQRLDTLESFMPDAQTKVLPINAGQVSKQKKPTPAGHDWTIKVCGILLLNTIIANVTWAGTLTIVDLSCPCVTPEGACALFNMCLSLFLEQETKIGRVVALDEAHKYMGSANEATALTNTLLSAIRLQRHLGTRVFISTQEPTISEKLLDLCSITIVHRFSSPDWLRCLKLHLAALDIEEDSGQTRTKITSIFNHIVKLRVGEALLFAPSAMIGTSAMPGSDLTAEQTLDRLGLGYLKIKIRERITTDGGKSIMATRAISVGGRPPVPAVAARPSQTFSPSAPVAFAPSNATPSRTSKPLSNVFGAPSAGAPPQSGKAMLSVFGTTSTGPNTASVSFSTNSQEIKTSSTPFGAPSPKPAMFSSPTNTVAPVPAVQSLKDRGTLGLNVTPVRAAALPNRAIIEEHANIFGNSTALAGQLFGNRSAQPQVGGVSQAKLQPTGGGLFSDVGNSSLTVRNENTPPTPAPAKQPISLMSTTNNQCAPLITGKSLSSSICASPYPPLSAPTNPAPPPPTTTHHTLGPFKQNSWLAQRIFCPGTRALLITPHVEKEPNSTSGQMNKFLNLCFQPTFQGFSQEELRLADYEMAERYGVPLSER